MEPGMEKKRYKNYNLIPKFKQAIKVSNNLKNQKKKKTLTLQFFMCKNLRFQSHQTTALEPNKQVNDGVDDCSSRYRETYNTQ